MRWSPAAAGRSGPIVAAILALVGAPAAAQEPAAIELRHRRIALDAGFDEAPRADVVRGEREHVFLWFAAPLTPEDHARLARAGVRVLRAERRHDVLVASVPRGSGPRLVESGAALGGQAIDWRDKLTPEVLARVDAGGPGEVRLVVQVFDDVGDAAGRAWVDGHAVRPVTGSGGLYRGTFEVGRVADLAREDAIESLESEPPPPTPQGELERHATGADQVQGFRHLGGPSFAGPTGLGVRIGVADLGVDASHPEFLDPITLQPRVFVDQPASSGHGTFSASIAAGGGGASEALGFAAYDLRGQAPRASIGDFPQLDGSAEDFFAAIETWSCDLTTHAYTSSSLYVAFTSKTDAIVRGDADHLGQPIRARPATWAAGNYGVSAQSDGAVGYYSLQTQAKNVIVVGSVDARDARLSSFSSLGPTRDGRLKPDVMAPGAWDGLWGNPIGLVAAVPGGFGSTGATSPACSAAAGVLALLMERRNELGIGPDAMAPSTWRALLIQGARDVVQADPPPPERRFANPETGVTPPCFRGPDWATGHGVVDARRSDELLTRGAFLEGTLIGPGSFHRWCFQVPPGADEVKVTLAWDDPASSVYYPPEAAKLVHDLDLEVVRPDSSVLRPWVLAPPPRGAAVSDPDPILPTDLGPAQRGKDDRNNVEVASEPHPMAGTWEVRVRASSVNAGPQRYSLVLPDDPQLCFVVGGPIVESLCDRYPQLCKVEPGDRPEFDPRRRKIRWTADRPLRIDQICRYALDCPGCEGGPAAYCVGYSIRAQGLPEGATLVLVTDRAEVVAEVRAKRGAAVVRMPEHARDSRAMLIVVDERGRPFEGRLEVAFGFES